MVMRSVNLCQLEYLLFLIVVVVVVVVMMVVVGEDLDHQHRTKPNHHSQLMVTKMRISKVMMTIVRRRRK